MVSKTTPSANNNDAPITLFLFILLAMVSFYSVSGLLIGLIGSYLLWGLLHLWGLPLLYGFLSLLILGLGGIYSIGLEGPLASSETFWKGILGYIGRGFEMTHIGKFTFTPRDTLPIDEFMATLPTSVGVAGFVGALIFIHPTFFRNEHARQLKRLAKNKAKAKPTKPSGEFDVKQINNSPGKPWQTKKHLPGFGSESKSGSNSRLAENATLFASDLQGKPVYLKDKDAHLHTLIVGTTGSGKTTTLNHFIHSAVIRKMPLFFVDGKGDIDLAERVQGFCEDNNRPFYLFSMVGQSVRYNPLSTGGFTSKKDRIIELREWSEEHYKKLAEGYLQTLFRCLEKAGIDVDLHQLSRYMDTRELYQLARERKDSDLIAAIEKIEEAEKHIGSLKAEIQNFVSSEIGELFDTSAGRVLNLSKAYDEGAVVYFCLQPLAFPSYASVLGKLIINDLKALAAQQLGRTDGQSKIFTIFDEFSVFAGDQVINLINQGRGPGIHAFLSTQSLSDLAVAKGKDFVGQVLTNCNNYIIQRQNNPEDAEILAGVIGTRDSADYTAQIDTDGSTGMGSVRRAKEFICHPDQIKRLGLGEAIFVNKQVFQVRSVKVRPSVF